MRHFVGLIAILGTACTGTLDMGSGGPDDPPSNEVAVMVKDGNIGVPGVSVIFQNADDTVIAEMVTDANGVATIEMTTGNVTVVRTFPPPVDINDTQRPPELYTYLGVQGGDSLQLGDATNETAPPSAINVMVPSTANGNVTVDTPCGSGTGQAPLIPITVRGCDPNLIVYVTDGDQASFVATAPYGENVDVSLNSFLSRLGTTISAANVQPDTQIQVEKRLVMGDYTLFSTGQKRIDQTPADVQLPDLSGSGVDQLLLVALTDANGRTQRVATRAAFETGLSVIDGSVVGMIPYVSNPDYSPTGLSWVEAGPAAGQADSVVTTMTISKDIGGGIPGPNDVYVRAIIAPHTGMTVRMPTLPASAAMFNPGATDQINGRLGLVQVTGGYDAIRANAFHSASVLDSAPLGGSVVLSYAGGTPPSI